MAQVELREENRAGRLKSVAGQDEPWTEHALASSKVCVTLAFAQQFVPCMGSLTARSFGGDGGRSGHQGWY